MLIISFQLINFHCLIRRSILNRSLCFHWLELANLIQFFSWTVWLKNIYRFHEISVAKRTHWIGIFQSILTRAGEEKTLFDGLEIVFRNGRSSKEKSDNSITFKYWLNARSRTAYFYLDDDVGPIVDNCYHYQTVVLLKSFIWTKFIKKAHFVTLFSWASLMFCIGEKKLNFITPFKNMIFHCLFT